MQVINLRWYEDDQQFFEEFVSSGTVADETTFYFKDDPSETVHYIGYLPEYESPYWAGFCDIPNGTDFKTAEELFTAKIYDGKSIRERWHALVVLDFGAIPIEEYPYSR